LNTIQYEDYTLGTVVPEHFEDVWSKISHFLEPALDDTMGLLSIDDLRIICKTGASQLWVVTKSGYAVGAFVTKVQQAPKFKILDIEYLGGIDFQTWGIDLMKEFEKNAKEQGITAMRICGRKGWAKLFKDYKEQTHIIAKVL
jgi:hypothetical protein